MTKYSGLGLTFTLDNSAGSGVAITNDVGSFTVNTPLGEQDVTGLDKSAIERLQLLEDCDITVGGNGFPSSTTMAVFTNRANSRTLVIGYPNSVTATVEVMIFGFTISRGQDGGMTWQATLRLCNGTALAYS